MQAKELACKIVSVGAWGSYFSNWGELQQLMQSSEVGQIKNVGPKPAVIPANERRRAPLPVRLAVESSWQATQAADVPPESLTCVFVSGLGDTDLTDYMCKTLASEHKELSPTKFHNSVHNAPAGYWTISTKTMSAANSVAGFEESVSLTLLEAMIQCESENVPLLVTFYDAPVADVLLPMLANRESFAFSLILYPASADIDGTLIRAKVSNHEQQAQWPQLQSNNEYIAALYANNPTAKILSLVPMLSDSSACADVVTMPLSKGSSITFQRAQGRL